MYDSIAKCLGKNENIIALYFTTTKSRTHCNVVQQTLTFQHGIYTKDDNLTIKGKYLAAKDL